MINALERKRNLASLAQSTSCCDGGVDKGKSKLLKSRSDERSSNEIVASEVENRVMGSLYRIEFDHWDESSVSDVDNDTVNSAILTEDQAEVTRSFSLADCDLKTKMYFKDIQAWRDTISDMRKSILRVDTVNEELRAEQLENGICGRDAGE